MAESIFGTDFLTEEYILNNYNFHKFDKNHILVTAEHGGWALLSRQEFELFKFHRAHENPALYSLLKEKGLIISEENVLNIVEDYKKRHKFLFQGPSLHIVVPTFRCNQTCVYCHSRAMPDESSNVDMDKKTAKKTVDFIFKSPARVIAIEFQGGECLLNYKIVEYIIDSAKRKAKKTGKRVGFALVTNLTLMNDEILESLKKRKIKGIATSLDGPKKVHDKNRKYLNGVGSYKDVANWVKKIKKEWEHDFNLNALCTVTRHSFEHGKEIVDEYLKLGFNGVWLRPLNNIGVASDKWSRIGYSMNEFFEFYKKTLNYIIKKNLEGKKFNELTATLVLKKIIQKNDPLFADLQSPCGAGIGQLLYNYKGEIFTCDEGKIFEEFKLGSVHSSEYADIFNETLITMMDLSSKKNYLCDACVWSPYCGICPVYTYASQGTLVSLLPMDDKCKLYSKIIKTIFEKTLFSEQERKILFDWYKTDRVFNR